MKKLLLLIFGISLLFSIACNNDDDDPDPTPTPTPTNYDIIVVEDYNIETATVWKGDKLYVLEKDLDIKNVLTIEPGCIIKLASGVNIEVKEEGTILANGTSEKPIIFTSIRDDAHGGDTNGDALLTQPAAKNWDHIYIDGNGSSFDYCQFYYGGGYDDYTMYVWREPISITNCTFAHNEGSSSEDGNAALTLTAEDNSIILTGNIFYDNNKPLSISSNFDIDDSNIFHNPDDPSMTNTYNGIFVNSYPYDLVEAISWGETEVPFVFYSSWDIDAGGNFTIEPGCILKFSSTADIEVYEDGTILANGTSQKPIIFTSYKDDKYGGDTNADGALTQPAPKDWEYIYIDGNDSSFDYCHFYYGGGDNDYTMHVWREPISITNCTFAHNEGSSSEGGNAALTLTAEDNSIILTGNVFYDNNKPLSISSNFDIDDSNIFHNPDNPSVTNTYNGIFMDSYPYDLEESITWSETEVPFVFHSN